MKILKIEFQNINSLKGPQKLDFTIAPFTTSSLFAITGPTGSGKSTILDVISLALFNQVPRLGKISKSEIINKGAIITRNQKEAFAKVTYQAKSGTYASFWSISTNRNNNLRDYEMQIFDVESGKALDLKKSDVPARNEALIGLTYDQFIKSVLLAQGEFAQFLKAKKDERGELLEKITDTGIYRQVGMKAFQKKKEVFAEIEKEQQEIELHRKSLLTEEKHRAFSEELLMKSKSCEPLEAQIDKLKKHLQVKKDIKERTAQLETHQNAKNQAEKALEEFQVEHGQQLQKHEKIRLFGEELHFWKQLNANCEELRLNILENLESTEKNVEEIRNCLGDVQKLIQQDTNPQIVEEKLQEFSSKVQNLQQLREDKGKDYKALKREFDSEMRDFGFQLNGDLEIAEEKLRERQVSSRALLEELASFLSNIDLGDSASEKQRLRKAYEKARRAQQQSIMLQNLAEELRKVRKETENIAPQLEELPKEITLEKAQAETLQERLEKLQFKKENENLRKSLEEHRHQLKKGCPCPLCGAQEHPFAHDLPTPEDGLMEEIKTAETALIEKQRQVTSSETTFAHYQKRLQELQQYEQETAEKLKTLENIFEEEFGVNEFTTNWTQRCSEIDQQIHALENYDQERKKLEAVSAGLPIIKNLQTVVADGSKLKKQLEELYPGEDIHKDCSDLHKRWIALQHQKVTLAGFAKELEGKLKLKKEQLRQLEQSLLPKLEREGCKDISEALERLLPEERAAQLRKKKEELCNETTRAEAAIKMLLAEHIKLKEKDIEESSHVLEEELSKNQEELQGLKDLCEELRRKLRNHNDILQKIENIDKALVEKKIKIRRWELLNQLIGDSTGKKFNDFAQDLSLSQLLRLANVRLKDLSDRYRMDKPLEEEDDSLVAIDEHMGGQRRSVKTLSGGETFILSLSMALALSDLASKNVEINSLFIDEGFGTLDPETLDQTLTTLEKLQAESSKTIGIISHVDSLKERIAAQVRLKRNGQGYSSLEVTG